MPSTAVPDRAPRLRLRPLLLGIALVAQAAVASPPSSAGEVDDARPAASALPAQRQQRIAECVAVLRTRSDGIVPQARTGDAGARAALLTDLQRGAAFIGEGYLAGERDEKQSQRRLDDAAAQQQGLSAAQRQRLVDGCASEGDQMLAQANLIHRTLLDQIARKRMRRLLEAPR